MVEMLDEIFAEHEWIEDGKGSREALIPADVINRFARSDVLDADY